MTGTLSQAEIKQLLHTHYTGHLACIDENGPYLVPITYYYDEDSHCLVSYTAEGRKVDALRKDPRVCVNVSDIQALNHWQSVLIEGVFEELDGMAAMQAIKLLITRLKEQINETGKEKVETIADMSPAKEEAQKVVYRIKIGQLSGRYERAKQESEYSS